MSRGLCIRRIFRRKLVFDRVHIYIYYVNVRLVLTIDNLCEFRLEREYRIIVDYVRRTH